MTKCDGCESDDGYIHTAGFTLCEECNNNRRKLVSALSRSVRGMGRSKANKIFDKVGSIDGLEETHADELLRIDGIGPSTISRIGIWNDSGEPVGTIIRDPCPNCGDAGTKIEIGEYDVKESVDVSDAERICILSSIDQGSMSDYTRTWAYLH